MIKPKPKAQQVKDYLSQLGRTLPEEQDVFLSVPVVAAALWIEQTTVRAYLSSGRLVAFILLDAEGWETKGVSFRSVKALIDGRRKRIDDQAPSVEESLWNLDGELIEYGQLMEQIGLSWRNPDHRGLIAEILGEVSMRTWASHGVMLSALVVNKQSRRPSEPFFDLAKDKESIPNGMRTNGNTEKFWAEQIELIRKASRKRKRG